MPFRSSPACILGTRHEYRWTPPQRYSGPIGLNASVSRLVVFRFSHIVSHLAVSRQMARQSANSRLHCGRSNRKELRLPIPTRIRADIMLHAHTRQSTKVANFSIQNFGISSRRLTSPTLPVRATATHARAICQATHSHHATMCLED